MTPNRLATAAAAVSLIALATACAGPGSRLRGASPFGAKVNSADVGLATRAQMALMANDVATALSLAERAVEVSPNDASFRTLLGNCYLAAGRFASAEAAYRDSLSLGATQPQTILKLVLVQIGLGKSDQAQLLLAEARGMIDPTDAGLALALAGDPQGAVALLEPVARSIGADARTRQNLALAHALSGDWVQARVVAAQDLPADQIDSRIQQWMALAKPSRASDQVASFIGIQPIAADPGQPVRLALHRDTGIQQAAAEPVPVTEAPAAVYAEAAPIAPPAMPTYAAPAAPVALAETPMPEYAAPAETPVFALREARPALSPASVRLSDSLPSIRKASAPRAAVGKSRAVVQIGAYSSRERVATAWSRASAKHDSLKRYVPVTAQFDAGEGTVYRLSVKGFESERDAIELCSSLKRAGSNCFVRSASGDSPVRFASRG
ncbi:SPOR domain-containing protein [Sphingomonas xanthus]|uniref:Tetratricopeptide repeat protein n=1 Tax=Sphingomonas xanthus TaxID=2594473 RepID=A0A516IP66_9SPHN|nr:SPOR domain-containing protein [Sphingomonas xanthus]QDP18677.1 tetratricopeptide repeat protein [Sphingomonas xanthus]